jgi:hypothetical protein
MKRICKKNLHDQGAMGSSFPALRKKRRFSSGHMATLKTT